jgi:hypothetical protein
MMPERGGQPRNARRVDMKPRRIVDTLVVVIKAVLISWALSFLAEHFGWSVVREAGGGLA